MASCTDRVILALAAASLSPSRVPIRIPAHVEPIRFLQELSDLFFFRSLVPRREITETAAVIPFGRPSSNIFLSLLEVGIIPRLRSNLAESPLSACVPYGVAQFCGNKLRLGPWSWRHEARFGLR